jgi:hypothetical protein
MSDERLTLHNLDVLLKIVTINPYIYRFFGRPPRPDGQDLLRHIIDIFGREDFRVPVGGAYPMEDFARALQPEKGKNYFMFPPARRIRPISAGRPPWPAAHRDVAGPGVCRTWPGNARC